MALWIKSNKKWYVFDEGCSRIFLGEQQNFDSNTNKAPSPSILDQKVVHEANDLPNAMRGQSSHQDSNRVAKMLTPAGKNLAGRAYTEAKTANDIGASSYKALNNRMNQSIKTGSDASKYFKK